MTSKVWTLVAVLAAVLLSGCASKDEKDFVASLPDITPTVELNTDWRRTVGDGVEDYWSSLSPAVNYGKVFVSDREGRVVALDAESGDRVWQQDLRKLFDSGWLKKEDGARLSGGVSTGFNKVFVGSENGALFALDAESGELVWEAKTRGEVLSDPEVIGSKVLVNTGAGKVQAFDVDTGEYQWQFDLPMPSLLLRGTSGIGQFQGAAFVGGADGKMRAIFVDSGAPIWEAQLAEATGSNELERVVDVDAKPVVLGSAIYGIAYNGNLTAVDLRSGRILWSRQYSGHSPIVVDGFDIYLTDSNGGVYAIDRRNGLEKWANQNLIGRGVTAPQLFGGYLVAGDFEGYLHVFDTETGELVGRKRIDSSGLYVQGVRAGDRLFIQARNGRVASVTIP